MSAAALPPVKLLLAAPEFYSANPKTIKVEENEVTNRTYFIKAGRIIAVGTAQGDHHATR